MSAGVAGGWRPAATVFRFTLLEAWRSRWWAMALAMLAAAAGAALFTTQLAITERTQVAVSTAAPLLRLVSVAMIAMLAVASTVRELGDRTVLVVLSAPQSRVRWLLARWAGMAVVASATAAAGGLLLLAFVDRTALGDLAGWALSLAAELSLVVALSTMFAMALRQVPASLLATFALYLLARLIGTMLLLAERTPAADRGTFDVLTQHLLELLGALLPRLDLFTRTEWLIDGAGAGPLIACVQMLLYGAIALAVTVIDLRGKEL